MLSSRVKLLVVSELNYKSIFKKENNLNKLQIMSPKLLIISVVLINYIANFVSGTPVTQDLFELKNENDGAQLLCSLNRNHPGHKDIVMVKDRHGANNHCHTRFSACDSNINIELLRLSNPNELEEELPEFTICQHGQNLVYDHLRGVFTVNGDPSDKRFEAVKAMIQDRNTIVHDRSTIKIAMKTKSEHHPNLSNFLLSRQHEESYGSEEFFRVFHGQIHDNPSLESFFAIRI